jgi:DNA-binding phage protein
MKRGRSLQSVPTLADGLRVQQGRASSDDLKAAFFAEDLRQISRAVDATVLERGITPVSQNAQVDRTTIFRAFRRENGPALDTMVRVRHVLGWRLRSGGRYDTECRSKHSRACLAIGAFLSAVLTVSAALSDDHRVDHVSIVERGIFQASSETVPIARSSFGSVIKVRNVSLVRSTTTILARTSLRFGLRYVVVGAPVGASVDIRLVTRFPESGLLDPATGIRHYESEYTIRGAIGIPAYREFIFDHSWEIVAGEWVFEFWQAGRNIGSQRFCVLDVDSPPHPSNLSRAINCGALIGFMEIGRRADLLRGRGRS